MHDVLYELRVAAVDGLAPSGTPPLRPLLRGVGRVGQRRVGQRRAAARRAMRWSREVKYGSGGVRTLRSLPYAATTFLYLLLRSFGSLILRSMCAWCCVSAACARGGISEEEGAGNRQLSNRQLS